MAMIKPQKPSGKRSSDHADIMRAVETAITIIIVAEDSALTTPYSIMALKLSSCLSTFHKPRFAKVLQIYLLLYISLRSSDLGSYRGRILSCFTVVLLIVASTLL
ncbi:hypothetical protein I7I53_08771 [Histoplasma capsulatum var. duboisii H88]|uniref:Uncharacterized protein n=1 Tax=Ajellomyces capsulatus (strain H88) TaxID=544711 RepID=A0A8A1L4Z7_AJEC8|nr:hypothetical protein I7I53_08771 [Histoplasma capsulatum var. duboisii H88]